LRNKSVLTIYTEFSQQIFNLHSAHIYHNIIDVYSVCVTMLCMNKFGYYVRKFLYIMT